MMLPFENRGFGLAGAPENAELGGTDCTDALESPRVRGGGTGVAG